MTLFYNRLWFLTPQDAPQTVKFASNITAGGVAGSLSLCFVYSLDYARTRLANDAKVTAKDGTSSRQFNGLVDVYKKTLASDGIAGLYRGYVIFEKLDRFPMLIVIQIVI